MITRKRRFAVFPKRTMHGQLKWFTHVWKCVDKREKEYGFPTKTWIEEYNKAEELSEYEQN